MFVTCSDVLLYIGSVSLCLALIPIFYQSVNNSKNDHAYWICKFVLGIYHWWHYLELGDSNKNDHAYWICKFVHGSFDIYALERYQAIGILNLCMRYASILCRSWEHHEKENFSFPLYIATLLLN